MLPGHLAAGMTVLERQQAHLRWQVQNSGFGPLEAPNQLVKSDPGLGNGWPDPGRLEFPGLDLVNPKLMGRQNSLKKRKYDSIQSTKVCAACYLSSQYELSLSVRCNIGKEERL